MAKKIKFPRTLYKKADRDDDTAIKWGKWKTGSPKQGGAYHSLVVDNQDELDTALEMGYLDDLEQAVYGEPVVEKDTVIGDEGF